MPNLKERRLQLETLISNLQAELDYVNTQLEAENFKNEDITIKEVSEFDFENKEDTNVVRAKLIEDIIEKVSNESNVDIDVIERHHIQFESYSLTNKKWHFTGYSPIGQFNFDNAYLKQTSKALYLCHANGEDRLLLKYN